MEYRRQCQRMGCAHLLTVRQMLIGGRFCSDRCRQTDGRAFRAIKAELLLARVKREGGSHADQQATARPAADAV